MDSVATLLLHFFEDFLPTLFQVCNPRGQGRLLFDRQNLFKLLFRCENLRVDLGYAFGHAQL